MPKQYFVLIIAAVLCCVACNEHAKSIIPFRFVRRLPNDLEYYFRTIDSNEQAILKVVFLKQGTEFFIDRNGNFYVDASENGGDIKLYFWSITENFLVAKDKNSLSDSLHK